MKIQRRKQPLKRGAIIKQETEDSLILERKLITQHYLLSLIRKYCTGCGICADVCPKEAINLTKAVIKDGKLSQKPTVDLNTDKCNLCGICVVICPTNAFQMTINKEPKIPVVETQSFPTLIKRIQVTVEKCTPTCKLACQEACPCDALEVIVQKNADGKITKILEVKINLEKCIYCKRCEPVCPEAAITVTKPYLGAIWLNTALCPKECQACVDICPSQALKVENEKIAVYDEFCIYCGACQKICPKEAIIVQRSGILHTEVKSGAWITALEKLTSPETMIKEIEAKSRRKLRQIVKEIS